MKLYATIENENGATVSKGSNELLTMTLRIRNRLLGRLYFTIEDNDDGDLIVVDWEPSKGDDFRLVEKTGEKQKGECQQTGCNKETMRPYAWCKKHFGERLAQSGGFLQD